MSYSDNLIITITTTDVSISVNNVQKRLVMTSLFLLQYKYFFCRANRLETFQRTGDWSTAALDPEVWCNTVREGGCRFMAAWVKKERNASEHQQRNKEAEEVANVEVAPGVTTASLKRFRAALIGPTQGLPKRCRLCR